jgi:hypothetical protein
MDEVCPVQCAQPVTKLFHDMPQRQQGQLRHSAENLPETPHSATSPLQNCSTIGSPKPKANTPKHLQKALGLDVGRNLPERASPVLQNNGVRFVLETPCVDHRNDVGMLDDLKDCNLGDCLVGRVFVLTGTS